jgi:hypothetical protein
MHRRGGIIGRARSSNRTCLAGVSVVGVDACLARSFGSWSRRGEVLDRTELVSRVHGHGPYVSGGRR